ncbi:response regulator [Pseudomonas mosselii]|uniref:response regulator n=1 Tax=Pseudomonas mosselii TaxID=78327 RepID=UPI00244C80AB|nr:response regulator [Pseudomonas mosselii]MDH1510441.1 response regulator [Pseudomonas mosselii]
MSIRIMVVDDDPWMSELIRQMIQSSRPAAEVECFSCVETALAAWRSGLYQLVLSDWNLPDGAGVDLLRTMRMSDSELPLVVITGRSDRQSVLEVRQLGISAYITKPFDIPAVMAKINALLPEDEPAPAAPALSDSLETYLGQLSASDLDLPLFSSVKESLQQAFSGVATDFRELAIHWQNEPALCAYLISAANSAAYGGGLQPCEGLAQALTRLGGRTALNLAIAMALRQSSVIEDPLIGLWLHEQFVASERLAERVVSLARQSALDPGPLHAAALLHRIGELWVLYQVDLWAGRGHAVDDDMLSVALARYGRAFALALKARWALPMSMRDLIGAVYALPKSHVHRDQVIMRLAAAIEHGESVEAIARLKALAGLV